MNNTSYTNLPMSGQGKSSSFSYNNLYTPPLEIDTGTLDAMKGLFTSRGFDNDSAESISIIIIKQARLDNYNPMQIMDTLKGLNNVEISALVAEIVNYNRLKTSVLGYARGLIPNEEVARNIIP